MPLSEVVEQVCGWVGSAIAMFFYISPVVPFTKLMKGQVDLNTIPGVLLLCSLLNCLLWCEFGLQVNKLPVWICNAAGAATTVIWLVIYWTYFAQQKWIPAIVYNFLMLNVIGEIFYICYTFCGNEYNYVVGYIAMVFNTLMYAAPGEKIVQVIKKKDYTLIPIVSCIAGVFCSSFWGVYAIFINEITMMIPNFLGVIFAILQIICWVYYKNHLSMSIIDTKEGLIGIKE